MSQENLNSLIACFKAAAKLNDHYDARALCDVASTLYTKLSDRHDGAAKTVPCYLMSRTEMPVLREAFMEVVATPDLKGAADPATAVMDRVEELVTEAEKTGLLKSVTPVRFGPY